MHKSLYDVSSPQSSQIRAKNILILTVSLTLTLPHYSTPAQAITTHLFSFMRYLGWEKPTQRQIVFGQTIYIIEHKISFQFELEKGKAAGQITH